MPLGVVDRDRAGKGVDAVVNETFLWIGFATFIVTMLVLDLGVFHRRAHAVSLKEAGIWVAVWVSLALIFNLVVYYLKGSQAALAFLTAYLIEESLSIDNMFVFLMLFAYFGVKAEHQHRVLFWGIVGALVMRGIFIAAGVTLLAKFHWLIYVFGAFLVYTGIKMASPKVMEVHPEHNPVLKLACRFIPITKDYVGQRFLTREAGRLVATPLLLVLLIVESTDVVFAVDSIPAVLAVTRDPLIIYTSNAFAILGLRSIFFVLAGIMGLFKYLKVGLSVVLTFVGAKMLISGFYEIPIAVSLGVVFGVLFLSVLISVLLRPEEVEKPEPEPDRG